MPKAQQTILEINLKSLEHNFKFLKSKIANTTKFIAVVKASAYGSDVIEIAECLEILGVDYFAVAYASEGIILRNSGIQTPILVLHPKPINFKNIIKYKLEPNLYTQKVLETFIKEAKQQYQENYPIHIKFNTGLNRLGFLETDIDSIVRVLNKTKTVKVKSIFSHLAASEDLNEREFTLKQINKFKSITKHFLAKIDYAPLLHILNTSGILNYPEAQFNMVRSGIGLYGFGNDPDFDAQLKPIASLKSTISQIHIIGMGESLGYNRAFVATQLTKTATIPVGHADGISRQYGNGKGYVFINNQKAPILGNVCMDMLMVNVTHINCKEGDEVLFFDNNYTASDFASTVNTISYELITGISKRIKRKIIK